MCDTIENVKAKIQEKTQIPPDKYFLTFEHKPLEDEQKIEHYKISRDSTLWMVFIVFVCINTF
jgi:hypothetical protein